MSRLLLATLVSTVAVAGDRTFQLRTPEGERITDFFVQAPDQSTLCDSDPAGVCATDAGAGLAEVMVCMRENPVLGDRLERFPIDPTAARLTLDWPKGKTVSGTVFWADGGVAADVWLRLSLPTIVGQERGIRLGTLGVNSRSDGSFTFVHVPPGSRVLNWGGRKQHETLPLSTLNVTPGQRDLRFVIRR